MLIISRCTYYELQRLVEIYFALKDVVIVDCVSNLFRSIRRVICVIYIFIVYSVKNNFVLRF